MADILYETYQHYGTNAERLAFVPAPPGIAGVQPIYIWYETDTGNTYLYDTAWHLLSGAGGSGILQQVTTLTNAQIKALRLTSIAISPVPAAGFWVKPISLTYSAHIVVAYTGIDAYSDIGILTTLSAGVEGYLCGYVADDNSMTVPLTGLSDLIATVGERLIHWNPASIKPLDANPAVSGQVLYEMPYVRDATLWDNQALRIAATNAADFTGGDPLNTLKVTLNYILEEL